MRIKLDWFLVGMVAAIALAWLTPDSGARGGWMHPQELTRAAVALIFFLHGARLSFTALRDGALHWRLHLIAQVCTFGLFPVLGMMVYATMRHRLPDDLDLGLFFLCALPSTISSAIILTAIARGNVAGAVFNATVSNLIGVVLTPLWVAGEMRTTGHLQPLGPVMLDLFHWLVLPLAAGHLTRRWIGEWLSRYRARVSLVDRAAILLIVYTAFCDSFKDRIWANDRPADLIGVALLCLILFTIAILLIAGATHIWGFRREDRIAAMFCGSKKTLAAGIPMAKVIFGAHPGLGLILLPIMIYHPLQLVICGVLAQRWAKEVDGNERTDRSGS